MNRIFSVVTLCFAISGCSFFSTPMSTSETVKASIGKHINTVKGSSTAKVTSLDNGGKKYVITQRFEPMAPMPCYQSSFDDSPSFCGTEFGMPGSSDTSTYLVNSKGVVYDVSYESELIPVPAGEGINYIR